MYIFLIYLYAHKYIHKLAKDKSREGHFKVCSDLASGTQK